MIHGGLSLSDLLYVRKFGSAKLYCIDAGQKKFPEVPRSHKDAV